MKESPRRCRQHELYVELITSVQWTLGFLHGSTSLKQSNVHPVGAMVADFRPAEFKPGRVTFILPKCS